MEPMHHKRCGLLGILGLVLLPAASSGEYSPIFRLGFVPCGERLEIPAGLESTREFAVRLTTIDNPDPGYGAQGWSLSIVAEGVTLTAITTRGTLAAEATDDPPGLRSGGFERTELAQTTYGPCEGRSGAVSAVVLSFKEPIALPSEGPATIARITVRVRASAAVGETAAARLDFVDGCRGAGGPISNVVTVRGTSRDPEPAPCEFEIAATGAAFLRGDANADGKVDLSDAMSILGCKFLGGACPPCRDAGDSNDDGNLDVSDAIHILSFLFLGGESPADPGPYACGPDPTPEDALGECIYTACPR